MEGVAMNTATQTPTIQLLAADWETTVKSPQLENSVRRWTCHHPVLSAKAASEIIQLIAQPCWSYMKLRDETLSCLLKHGSEQLSQRAVLQSLLPQVIHMVDKSKAPDLDEQAAYVVSVASEQIAHFKRHDITCVHWWLYQTIKRQIQRNALVRRQQQFKEQCLSQNFLDSLEEDSLIFCWQQIPAQSASNSAKIADLINLITTQGEIDRLAAEIIVLTRTEALTVSAMSTATGLAPDTLRKKRLRAEKRLRQKLSRADFA